MKDVATRKAVLEARMGDLTGRLQGIEHELDSKKAQDWEDLATEREGDEVLEGMGLSGQHEIRMIQGALQRIEDGTYGLCTKCGEQISEARLDVVPSTPLCSNCAA